MTIPATTSRLENLPDILAFDTRKADWDLFRSHLLQEALVIPDTPDLEELATFFSNAISSAAKASIPKSRRSPYSKPWWTSELRDLRKELARSYKTLYMAGIDDREVLSYTYLSAQNSYFQAIKKAKRDY